MILNKSNLQSVNADKVMLPTDAMLELPEKVLQFGTGVLLRGLPDFFIDKANRQGVFNGRVVVVKSTDHGTTKDFDNQDSLYTLSIKGIENGKAVDQTIVSSAISRVLTAGTEWNKILEIAASNELEVVISNTTEVGIQLVEDNIHAVPPISFPGKLLAVLHHRYKTFSGAKDKGLVIVPTELIVDNGTKLEEILVTLAKKNNLSSDFIIWLKNDNEICNSLVDCIVPGKPGKEEMATIEQDLGYQDDLLIMSEVYRLWAISGSEKTKEKLSFAYADKGVIVTPDINLHRELKLRLLNGTHTLSCGLAYLAGCETVKLAMDDSTVESYVANLMHTEIAPAIPYDVTKEQTEEFALNVLDRFRNPYINHQWLSITANYSSKLKMRVVPVLLNYVEQFQAVPDLMALGFAAYIRFMKPFSNNGDKYYGFANGVKYLINDTKAEYVANLWNKNEAGVVEAILSDTLLWGVELSALPGFSKAVNNYLQAMDSPQQIKEIIKKEIAQIEA